MAAEGSSSYGSSMGASLKSCNLKMSSSGRKSQAPSEPSKIMTGLSNIGSSISSSLSNLFKSKAKEAAAP